MVKVHSDEGIAIYIGTESCASYREVCGEALTGERAGQPLNCETVHIQDAGGIAKYGTQNERVRYNKPPNSPALS